MISVPRIHKRRGRPIRASHPATTRWQDRALDRVQLSWRYCRHVYGRAIQALIFPLVLFSLGAVIVAAFFNERPLQLVVVALAGGVLTAVVDKLSTRRKQP